MGMELPIKLMNYFGAKRQATARGYYPDPEYRVVIEPFAGGAGYSCIHHTRDIVLIEKNPIVASVLRYLIEASPRKIMRLPLLTSSTQSVDDFDISQAEKALIGFWIGRMMTYPRKTLGKKFYELMYNPNTTQIWGKACRERLANTVALIKHWQVHEMDFQDAFNMTATWFVDPPYQTQGFRYKNGTNEIDFKKLAEWCKSRNGQVIVCEGINANWLPFRSAYDLQHNNAPEMIWTQSQ
jgi:hypothetical protein